MPASIRVDQLLSRFGYCSRRAAAAWVDGGRVRLDSGMITDPSQRVDPARVLVDGRPVDFPQGLLVMLHKPRGYACSHDPEEAPLVYDLLPAQWMQRHPVPGSIGRLDRDTSGLLLITDDGALSHRLTAPKHQTEKCYEVTTAHPLPDHLRALFAAGTLLLQGESKPCLPARMEVTGSHSARLFLHEGKYHQVRRMFASQGCPVTALHRSAIGHLHLGGLPPGAWREIQAGEIS